MSTIECGSAGQPDLLVARGPTLPVMIGRGPDLTMAAATPTDAAHAALLDTGADTACIDSDFAYALNLPVVHQETVSGVHGRGLVNLHLAQIYLPGLSAVFSGAFAGAGLKTGGQPYTAILGRDFLRHFRSTYNGRTGAVTLSND